jgi:CoA-transferase family III
MDAITQSLLEQAWLALGGDRDLLDRVQVDDVSAALLPSPLPVLHAATAAVAASTLAASVLTAARAGKAPAGVSVDPSHVAVAARSEAYASIAGQGPGDLFAPLSRFWRTSDGWIRLHANYSWHRERALAVIGSTDAIASWAGEDLEQALADAGALGSFVRTPEAWAAHSQGAAAAELPLLETTSGPSSRLAGNRFRVLDLTRVIAGPEATRTLAAYGADVLRVDPPQLPEIPAQAMDTLQGKRSTFLDLRDRRDRSRFEDLLDQADVLVHSYRPGALDAFGLGSEELVVRRPDLVVVAISAWGPGPWAGRRGFDSLVQCTSGIAAITANPDGSPGTLPAQLLDHGTGYLAAAAAMLALAGRAEGAGGSHTRLSLAQTSRWLQDAPRVAQPTATPVDPTPYLVDLPGPQPVRVVSPPGRVDGVAPAWHTTTALGVDPPQWR